MKIFLSSTFRDLVEEREAVLAALQRKRQAVLAMEHFLAVPRTSVDVALENLHSSDVVILVIGFKAGSLLPDDSGSTYTSAEYDEAVRLGKSVLPFVKLAKRRGSQECTWRNSERTLAKRTALDEFKRKVGAAFTWDTFKTPEELALNVILALERWDAEGRPGARRTFATPHEYFAAKASRSDAVRLLDFETSMLGRNEEMQALARFADEKNTRVCIVRGRGGIGKTKLLHDWAFSHDTQVMFLKDEPVWHEESYKEIPIGTKFLIVDDAHRQESLGGVVQSIQEMQGQRTVKLIVSTRPGGVTRLSHNIYKHVDPALVTTLPEMGELTPKQSEDLAREILGPSFSHYAEQLAEVSSHSPLVIVAGGRLIANRKIDPSALATLEQFRATIFDRFLDEIDLHGPNFAIDPPRPILNLIAALGPLDADHHGFQTAAASFFGKRQDEVVQTIDALAETGIITQRGKPIRILPDVLSDFILEQACVNASHRSTGYAKAVYDAFGSHSLSSLMRNLSELDWRLDQNSPYGLRILDQIWADITRRFQAADEYERQRILADLGGTAIYQPDQVLRLIRLALDSPITVLDAPDSSLYRFGQQHVLSAIPDLLEATAHHPDWISESVDLLWLLASNPNDKDSHHGSAKAVLKRLASWNRYVSSDFNFQMLLQAVRLTSSPGALSHEFTPFKLIAQILEPEGEFNEWQDENTLSFGGFGLNYNAVGPVRENALDFLETCLKDDTHKALRTIEVLNPLLHYRLNRVRRASSEDEIAWQNQERRRVLEMLTTAYSMPGDPLVRTRLFDAIRSATAVSVPEMIREKASAIVATQPLADDIRIMDAICTAQWDLPVLDTNPDKIDREESIQTVIDGAKQALDRLADTNAGKAKLIVNYVLKCHDGNVKTNGFHGLLAATKDATLTAEVVGQILADIRSESLANQLLSAMQVLHEQNTAYFAERARSILANGSLSAQRAAAWSLRVMGPHATKEDFSLIKAYSSSEDDNIKAAVLHAIAYMGQYDVGRADLLKALLAIESNGSAYVASELADAFGPYGLPKSLLTRSQAQVVLSKFLAVKNWNSHQSHISDFLTSIAGLFPDEVFRLLIERIGMEARARAERDYSFRSFDLTHENISFGNVPLEKRISLARECLCLLLAAERSSLIEFAEVFLKIVGSDEECLETIIDATREITFEQIDKILAVIERAKAKFAVDNPSFAKRLIQSVSGSERTKVIEALAVQICRMPTGVFSGRFESFQDQHTKSISSSLTHFAPGSGLEEVGAAVKRIRITGRC